MGSRQQLGRTTKSFWGHWLEAQTKQTAVLQPGPVVGHISCMGLQAPAMQKKKSMQREIEGLKTTIDDVFFSPPGRTQDLDLHRRLRVPSLLSLPPAAASSRSTIVMV